MKTTITAALSSNSTTQNIKLSRAVRDVSELEKGADLQVNNIVIVDITQMLMVALEPGKYYLRIEVNWVKESVLNEGRLVAYCTEGNFKL